MIPPALRLGGGPESPEPLLLHTSVVMHECFIKHSTCLFKGEQYSMNQVFCAIIFHLKHDSGFLFVFELDEKLHPIFIFYNLMMLAIFVATIQKLSLI